MEERELKVPIESGIPPWKLLFLRFRCTRLVRFDNQSGMVELIPLEERSSELREVKLMNFVEGILRSHLVKFSVSKEGNMLTGWNQSIWLPIVIPEKSKCFNDDNKDTHRISSLTIKETP